MTPPVFPSQVPPSSRTPMETLMPVFVTVFLITVIITTAVTFILPETYGSTARVKVDKLVSSTNAYAPYFLQTEFEVIQSEEVLNRAVEKLKLNEVWGRKYFAGQPLKTAESLQILKARLNLAPVRNTMLVAITVYSDDRREAADVANAVAEAYRDYSIEKKYPAGAVEIIDRAEPSLVPCKPNKTLNIALGAVAGIVFGGLAAALVWGFTSRRR